MKTLAYSVRFDITLGLGRSVSVSCYYKKSKLPVVHTVPATATAKIRPQSQTIPTRKYVAWCQWQHKQLTRRYVVWCQWQHKQMTRKYVAWCQCEHNQLTRK